MSSATVSGRTSDVTQIWGRYLGYSIYIENCYFEKWRHSVCAATAAHTVVRFCVIDYDYGCASLDGHGAVYNLGQRLMEIYNNTFINCLDPATTGGYDYNGVWHGSQDFGWGDTVAVHIRGGSALITNNTVDASYAMLAHLDSDDSGNPNNPDGQPNDVYIWNNYGTVATMIDVSSGYYLYAPTGYTPYTYPHPLTSTETGSYPNPPATTPFDYGSSWGDWWG
jgi:hypothetical protein